MKRLLLAAVAACALVTAIPTHSASAMTPTSLATVAAGGDDAAVLVKHGGGHGGMKHAVTVVRFGQSYILTSGSFSGKY